MRNGTVIAVGDVVKNEDLYYSNKLGSFLFKDKNIESVLGVNFKRKFPAVWCTLGYYRKRKEIKIGNDLEYIFRQCHDLNSFDFRFPISEI